MAHTASSIVWFDEARQQVAFSPDAVFRSRRPDLTVSVEEKEKDGRKQVFLKFGDGHHSDVFVLPDVILSRLPPDTIGYVWSGPGWSRLYDTATTTTLLMGVPVSTRDALCSKIGAKINSEVAIPQEDKQPDYSWFPVRASSKLAFTAASEYGVIERLQDLERFIDKSQSTLVANAGVKIVVVQSEDDDDMDSLDVSIVDAHLKDLSAVSPPRGTYGIEHVTTDRTPSINLLEKLRETGFRGTPMSSYSETSYSSSEYST